MALQNATYANSGNCYYVASGGAPIVPGDQTIQGPIEIAATIPNAGANFYNRFSQDDTNGLTISENQLPTTLKSRIVMGGAFPSVQISAVSPGIPTSLTVGQASGIGNPGQVTLNGNEGLVLGDSAGSGASLQIVHETATNTNILRQFGSINSVAMRLLGNTNALRFANPSFPNNFIEIPQANNSLVLANGTLGPAFVNTISQTGMTISTGTGSGGALGTFGGATMTLDSRTSTTIRTNTIGTPLTNATFNQDGSVTFLNTITAQIGSFLTSITTPLINAVTGAITTLNSTTGNITTVNSTTINNVGTVTSGTVNSTTLTNTGLTTTGTLIVNTSAAIPALTGVTTLNALPIDRYLGPPVGTMIMWGGSLAPPAILPVGYLPCLGITVPIATYSALYSVIGDSFAIFGPAPTGQFTLPDMRGKASMGATWIGQTGGSFQIRGTDMANLGNPAYIPPIDPATGSQYARTVVLVITTVEGGQILTVGQTVTLPGYGSNTILGIINYRGQTDADTNNLRIVLIMSGNYPGLNFTNATFTVTSDLYNVGKTHFGNYTIQEGKEVGIHTHGTVATGSSAISAAANQRSEPTFSQPINQPNATFTIDNTQIISPYSMKTMPNACFANFLIKI